MKSYITHTVDSLYFEIPYMISIWNIDIFEGTCEIHCSYKFQGHGISLTFFRKPSVTSTTTQMYAEKNGIF